MPVPKRIDDKRDKSMPDQIVGRDLRKAARPGLARLSAVVSTLSGPEVSFPSPCRMGPRARSVAT